MNFGLTEEQEMLRTSARDFLINRCPKTLVRQLMEDEKGYSPELWKEIANLGWLGMMLPEEYGGLDMGFTDLSILCQEMGRAMLPSPFISTVVLAANCLLDGGSPEQKKGFLPRIADGSAVFALAVTEEDGDFWAGGIKARAVAQGDDYIINGAKMFVPDARAADYLLVAARTRHATGPDDGVSLFLVNARQWGIYIAPLKTMDETRKQADVSFNNVIVPAKNLVGPLHQAWPILKKAALYATAALCAEMVGGSEMAMEMTVSYVKERIQFDVPVGSFQAVKHRCADMMVGNEYARSLMEWASLSLDEEEPAGAGLAVSMAKAYCGDVYKSVTNGGVQLHGGIGFTWDHDMHLYFKRARSADTMFGDANYHRELVAQALD